MERHLSRRSRIQKLHNSVWALVDFFLSLCSFPTPLLWGMGFYFDRLFGGPGSLWGGGSGAFQTRNHPNGKSWTNKNTWSLWAPRWSTRWMSRKTAACDASENRPAWDIIVICPHWPLSFLYFRAEKHLLFVFPVLDAGAFSNQDTEIVYGKLSMWIKLSFLICVISTTIRTKIWYFHFKEMRWIDKMSPWQQKT